MDSTYNEETNYLTDRRGRDALLIPVSFPTRSLLCRLSYTCPSLGYSQAVERRIVRFSLSSGRCQPLSLCPDRSHNFSDIVEDDFGLAEVLAVVRHTHRCRARWVRGRRADQRALSPVSNDCAQTDNESRGSAKYLLVKVWHHFYVTKAHAKVRRIDEPATVRRTASLLWW